jgi:hypothetical protein
MNVNFTLVNRRARAVRSAWRTVGNWIPTEMVSKSAMALVLLKRNLQPAA